MQSRLPAQKNGSLLTPSLFTAMPKVRAARRAQDAMVALVQEAGWDAVATLAAGLTTLYDSLKVQPSKLGGDVPLLTKTQYVKTGDVISVQLPQYDGIPIPTVSYQWLRDASTAISGATNPTYTVVSGDIGHTLKCKITATNSIGSDSVDTSDVTNSILS